MPDPKLALSRLSSSQRTVLEDIIRDFEAAWQRRERPPIDAYLARVPAERVPLLLELVHVELERRIKAGEAVRVETYLQRYPEIAAPPLALGLIQAEFHLRQRQEPQLSLDEYRQRFPQLAADLVGQGDGQAATRDFQPRPAGAPTAAGAVVETVSALVGALRQHRLLEPAQLAELESVQQQFADPRGLCRELLQRSWLTPYQVNQVLQGRAAELVLGAYVVLARLGEGGMGAVFKARHLKMNRIVALKVIRKELLADPDTVRRFEREVQAAAQLAHPNVVTAYDAAQVGQTHFFAMEYVDGTDLAKLVKDKGPLAVGPACDYIRQAAEGLQHAHEQGLVHRDIKPHKLLLTSKGVVKILDMGLARLRQSADSTRLSGGLTQEGAVMGTPSYMAPEQALDAHQADIRADVYSLGCTLYFLLTGQPPFQGNTSAEVLVKHQLAEAEPVEKVRPEVPAPVAAVVRRMMAKKPEERFQTPGEVAQALRSPGNPGTKSLSETLPPGGIVSAGTVFPSKPASAASLEPTMLAAAARPKHRRALAAVAAAVLVVAGSLLAWMSFGGKNEQPLAAVTGPKTTPKPLTEEEAWRQAVAAMKPTDQVKAVEERLKKLNPKFKGNIEPEYNKDGVVGITVWTCEITDLSPVRALPRLQRLSHGGDRGYWSSKLTDLSPLHGLPLTILGCVQSGLVELSPLQGMPLTVLDVGRTRVSDLRPLKGMKLTRLDCQLTGVSDLSVLAGMPLTYLDCVSTRVSDLNPLDGLPLARLGLSKTRVSDLSPLRKAPLITLSIEETGVKDLSPLKGKKLEALNCGGTPVSDLGPLEGQPLRELDCGNTRVADLSPLRGMPLGNLAVGFTEVKDLSPLKGANLGRLSCNNTPITDLSLLKDMKLLTYLNCRGTEVTDLSPLRFIPLLHLHCDFKYERDEPILRKITTLKTINGKQAAEFWKEQDAAHKKA